jgi:hypothetical protein
VTTLTLKVDERTAESLRQLGEREGRDPSEIAARLLARAARPRPVYDTETLKAAYAEFADEDAALAESDTEERARLLAAEDTA